MKNLVLFAAILFSNSTFADQKTQQYLNWDNAESVCAYSYPEIVAVRDRDIDKHNMAVYKLNLDLQKNYNHHHYGRAYTYFTEGGAVAACTWVLPRN